MMIKINYHRSKRLFYKTIGKTEAGKPRMFWLGNDAAKATAMAQTLAEFSETFLEPQGLRWNEARESTARALSNIKWKLAQNAVNNAARYAAEVAGINLAPTVLSAVALPTGSEAAPALPRMTLQRAAEQHVRTMRAKQLSTKHVARAEAVFKQLYEIIPATTPLQQLGREQLTVFVEHFLARPTSKLKGKPMAVESVKRVFQYTRSLLEEIDGDQWDGPKAWRKLFKVRWVTLLTPAEQKIIANGKHTFETQELVDLYQLGNARQRLYLLLGLNCGFGQGEISTLMRSDVDIKAAVIDRIRHKTRAIAVRGSWVLWPQALELLRAELADKNERDLALLTREGRPLVDAESRTDSIKLAWDRLFNNAERHEKKVRHLSFGTLRKTSATWMLNHGGRQLQQQHLCHADGSVAARHYSGAADFTRLHEALRIFHHELASAGMFLTSSAPPALAQ
jgi:integrase